jgi:hypothetical protein
MKIAYVGNFEPEYSTENDVRKAFEHLGHQVIQYQENKLVSLLQSLEQYDYNLLLITGTWSDIIPLERWLDVMHGCATRGIPTATLHLDTFWGKSRGGRKWWREPMFHTAYIFTADGDYQKEWQALGKNHIWLPPAVRHDAAHFGTFRAEYACDVAFVGSNGVGYHEDVWSYRRELVDALRAMCQRNGWSFKNPGGDDPKIDRGEDINDFYASAKVTVGDSLCLKKEDSHYWSDRVPEALGRGGHLIMPYIQSIADMYNHKLPMYRWGDWHDLEYQVGSQLKSCDYKGNIDAREYCFEETKKNHTYINRVETILKEVSLTEIE